MLQRLNINKMSILIFFNDNLFLFNNKCLKTKLNSYSFPFQLCPSLYISVATRFRYVPGLHYSFPKHSLGNRPGTQVHGVKKMRKKINLDRDELKNKHK